MFKGMVHPGRFQATCVCGAPPGPNRVLQGQQKQNEAQEKKELLYHKLLHPSPLKSSKQQASKQQATSKQALLLSVLAIAPPHRSGLYSTLAILEPRWCPCQIHVFSQKLTGGAPGRRRQVGRCPPKTAHFVPQNSLFWPKTAPKPSHNGQTKANGSYTPRAPRLPREQEPFFAL